MTTRLRILLDQDPLPQYVIAGKLQIHPTTLSDYANGKTAPSWRHRLLLAKYFKLKHESELMEDVD
jgi:transcriptional regulator with XRE-family HTH domain